MPSIQVRDMPEGLYRKLLENAERDHRSLAQETIILLAKALEVNVTVKDKRAKILEEIRKDSEVMRKYQLSDPVTRIREDRER